MDSRHPHHHVTHAKISTHATHAKILTYAKRAIFLTHAKILQTHTTHAKVWPMSPTNPRTHTTQAPTLPHATHAI